jgi:hypothetical protein
MMKKLVEVQLYLFSKISSFLSETEVKASAGGKPQGLPSGSLYLDVRADRLSGKDSFDRVIAAVRILEPGQKLALRLFFNPEPLNGFLRKLGFSARSEKIGWNDYLVTYSPEPEELAKESKDQSGRLA